MISIGVGIKFDRIQYPLNDKTLSKRGIVSHSIKRHPGEKLQLTFYLLDDKNWMPIPLKFRPRQEHPLSLLVSQHSSQCSSARKINNSHMNWK